MNATNSRNMSSFIGPDELVCCVTLAVKRAFQAMKSMETL